MTTAGVVEEIQSFLQLIDSHNEESCSGHYFARIICLNSNDESNEPSWLSYPHQPFPFVIGPETVFKLKSKSVIEIFDFIGYERSYVKEQLSIGNRFYLVFFTGYKQPQKQPDLHSEQDDPELEFAEHHSAPVVATWENLLLLIEEYSPACAKKITPFVSVLASMPYDHYEYSIDTPPTDIYQAVYSFDSFAKSAMPPTASQARAFLRHALKCTKLFSGDGYSYDDNGCKGAREYLMPRVKIANLINSSQVFHLTDHLEYNM